MICMSFYVLHLNSIVKFAFSNNRLCMYHNILSCPELLDHLFLIIIGFMIIIYVYQLGTGGHTQEAKAVRGVYP